MMVVNILKATKREENAGIPPVVFITGRLKTIFILLKDCDSTCNRSMLRHEGMLFQMFFFVFQLQPKA